MSDLLRREYRHPNILTAVAQVILNWDLTALESFSNQIRNEALDSFQGVQKNSQHSYQVSFGGPGTPPSVLTHPSDGLEITADRDGSKIVLDVTGFRVLMAGPYKGRDYLTQLMDWIVSRLTKSFPHLRVLRVSIAYESNIPINDADSYLIEDYVTPRFELSDSRLNHFASYFHSVNLDLRNVWPGPFRCRIELSSGIKGSGIFVLVDVLDDSDSAIEEISNRVIAVKNLETHVFESLITDKTREIYGVII